LRAVDATYRTGPDGLCGDEDVGQMSALFDVLDFEYLMVVYTFVHTDLFFYFYFFF
jgi:hypothetical protein